MMLELKGKKFFFFIIIFFFLTTISISKNNIFPFFKIKKIIFLNNQNLEEYIKDDLKKFLINQSLITIKNEKISFFIDQSQWIKNFKIYKKYPDTITLKINEYNPIAIYNVNNENFFINDNFKLTKKKLNKVNNLNFILVSGSYNSELFKTIYLEIIKFPYLKENTKIIKFLELNRSELLLKNNVKIKLGTYNLNKQFNILIKLKDKFKNLKYIDLRNEDSVILNDR